MTGELGKGLSQSIETRLFHRLVGRLEGLSHGGDQAVLGPVVAGHRDDRVVESGGRVQAAQGTEGHPPGEVPGDAEDDRHVGRAGGVVLAMRDSPAGSW